MLHTVAFTANNQSSRLFDVIRRHDASHFIATIMAYGTWGSGTLSFYLSPDGGTTKIPMQDFSGAQQTLTADGSFNPNLGNSSGNNDVLSVWATLTGATTPSITVKTYDNR